MLICRIRNTLLVLLNGLCLYWLTKQPKMGCLYDVTTTRTFLSPWHKESYGKSVCKCCNSFKAFFSYEKGKHKRYTYWSCDKITEAINFLLDNIYARFDKRI